ncbi:hypothetical protein ACFQU2_11840 [Siccirubricoccus deserti]
MATARGPCGPVPKPGCRRWNTSVMAALHAAPRASGVAWWSKPRAVAEGMGA